ncbi:MAG: hypothetical protein GF344_07845 [Chitinivibrionales bacterium]|nr:hypothetical protein [Chitinivibrionales bacterium]MBD3356801.1 hypothetical protein [Chitinivibrionales bacterium]
MHIAYYITAHGYGHAVRAATIVNELSPTTTVTFRTNIPRTFFEEELHRPFNCEQGMFDCGCIQTDSVTVDIQRTLETYKQLADRHPEMLPVEVAWCRRNHIDCIVSDIVPFAVEIAQTAGIPSVAVSNFSWYDIYTQYVGHNSWFAPYLKQMALQYGMADLLLALHPARLLPHFKTCRPMPIVGRRGKRRTEELKKIYGIAPRKKIGLIYVGDFGMGDVAWYRLAEFEDWEFLGLHTLSGAPANYHRVEKRYMPYQDLSASADLIISKIGYGTYAESILNGVPLMYIPRHDFAEFPILEESISRWGYGHRLEHDQFRASAWHDVLHRVAVSNPPPSLESTGASECAAAIEAAA